MTSPQRKVAFAGLERREIVVLLLYVALLAFTLFHYQQSEDEGQAWIIARTYGLNELLFHMLRILGHPALYYLLLWGPAHLNMPLSWINWPFALIATAGIYLLLRLAPFPFYLRAVLPFGFALAYQYAVVARSYVLFPILGFLVAHFYREKQFKPLRMAVCLGLLANVSIHGTMVAIGFAIAYALRMAKYNKSAGLTRSEKKQALYGLGVFAASILFVAICIWPAKYLSLRSVRTLTHVAHRVLGPHDKSPASAGGAIQPVASPTASAAPTSSNATPQDPAPQDTLAGRLWLTLEYPMATFSPLAVSFELLVLVYLVARKRPILALPFALLCYFLIAVYEQIWHVELVWVTLVLVLWAAWDTDRTPESALQRLVTYGFAILAFLQLPWTVGAARYDMTHMSYPAKAASSFLKTLPPGTRIDGNGLAFRVLPYFPNFIFIDHGTARLPPHAGEPPPPVPIADFINEHADVILTRNADLHSWEWVEIFHAGYSVKHVFCGAPYFPNRPITPICLFEFEK
jgi:hypothetical protein